MTVYCERCGDVLGPEPEVTREPIAQRWLCLTCLMDHDPRAEDADDE